MGSATSGTAEMSPEIHVKSALFTAPTNAGYLEPGPFELFLMGAEVTFVWFTQHRGRHKSDPRETSLRGWVKLHTNTMGLGEGEMSPCPSLE